MDQVTLQVGTRVKGAEEGAQGVVLSAGFKRGDEGQDRRRPWVTLEPRRKWRRSRIGVHCVRRAPCCGDQSLPGAEVMELPTPTTSARATLFALFYVDFSLRS